MSLRNNFPNAAVQNFETTMWTVVLAASGRDQDAHMALEKLCRIYRPAIYGYLVRRGYTPENADDLTQDFFVHILDNDRLSRIDRAGGKFRTWLLVCLEHYGANDRKMKGAIKRGGGHEPISLDAAEEDGAPLEIFAEGKHPGKIFDQQWAKTLIAHVFGQLRERCRLRGKSEEFDILLPFLTGQATRGEYAEVAEKLGIDEGTVRTRAYRLRLEFDELLRAEIGRTVTEPSQIEEETQELKAALRD